MRRFPLLAAVAVLWLVGPAGPAWAHALLVRYHTLADRVEIHAAFDDGTAAAQAKVTVRDADKEIIAAGKTDARGVWSFSRPGPGAYGVTVDAGGGHVASVPLPVGDPAHPQDAPPQTGANREPETAASRGVKIGLGVGVIGLLGLALLVVTRQRQRPTRPESPSRRAPPEVK